MAKKSLLKGAVVLAAAGIIVKFIGAFFRIPLANFIGDVGMAYYTPAYSIYGFLLVFATTGIPVAISKMVSERCAVGQFSEAERVFKLSRTLMFVIGLLGFLILFFFGDMLAVMINNPGSALAMKATAPALLLVPIMSAYRGYFQGMQDMTSTAVSQVVEQIFRVACGLSLAVILMDGAYSFLAETEQERGAAGGCFGASAGAVGGLIVMFIFYLAQRKTMKRRIKNDNSNVRESNGTILKKIAIIAVPITIGAAIMPIVNVVDSSIVMTRLLDAGFDRMTSESMFGQLTGFASPIVQFPLVLIQAIVVSLVPMVSASNKLGDREELHNNISLGVRMTAIITLPAAVGLFVLSEPVLLLLYSSQRESAIGAAPCLQILSLGFIFLSALTIFTGALQGIGKQGIPVRNLFIGVVAKLIITWALVGIPAFNVKGAAIGTIATYMVAAVLDYFALKKHSGVNLSVKLTVIKPMISSVVMGVIVFVAYRIFFNVLGSNGTATILSVFLGIAIYGLMVIRTKTIEREEMMTISIGRKLVVICDKLRLW
ncbi:MAG: polysaccharide biosynthesis protein [Bacillota bacterium]|nr:polysaccharide biosynthesis protein [Bacillota bacterium]